MRGIIALVVLLWPVALSADGWRVLTGAEINAALGARVLLYEDGAQQNFFTDGRTLYEAGAGESWGKWWVEGARYCSSWPPGTAVACYGVAQSGLDIRFTSTRGDVTTGRYVDLN